MHCACTILFWKSLTSDSTAGLTRHHQLSQLASFLPQFLWFFALGSAGRQCMSGYWMLWKRNSLFSNFSVILEVFILISSACWSEPVLRPLVPYMRTTCAFVSKWIYLHCRFTYTPYFTLFYAKGFAVNVFTTGMPGMKNDWRTCGHGT